MILDIGGNFRFGLMRADNVDAIVHGSVDMGVLESSGLAKLQVGGSINDFNSSITANPLELYAGGDISPRILLAAGDVTSIEGGNISIRREGSDLKIGLIHARGNLDLYVPQHKVLDGNDSNNGAVNLLVDGKLTADVNQLGERTNPLEVNLSETPTKAP